MAAESREREDLNAKIVEARRMLVGVAGECREGGGLGSRLVEAGQVVGEAGGRGERED